MWERTSIYIGSYFGKTVDEFKGMKPEDIVTYIEGEPKIGIVPIEPGLTNIEKNRWVRAKD